MTESLEPIERTPIAKSSDRVNPADRSNPEKKDNGFSNALKEKMKEKLEEETQKDDEVILENEPEPEHDDKPEAEYTEATGDDSDEPEAKEDTTGDAMEHVDLKA